MKRSLSLAIVASAISLAASPVWAEDRRSVYTSIENADCRFDRGNGPGSEESQTKRCPGLARSRVIVDAGGTSTALGFDWTAGGQKRSEVRRVVVGWSLGTRLEWRGAGTGTSFRPDTMLVRVLFNRDGSPQVGHQVLAILSVRPGSACLRGVVDMTANAQPYLLARKVSDSRPGFVCGLDAVQVEGTRTEWTNLVIERSGTRD